MSEKKISNKTLASIIPVIIFLLYTVITFVIWNDYKDSGFWLGWIFSLIATVIMVSTIYVNVKKGKEVKSILDGFSVHYITSIYFVAQLVLGLFCMILNEGPMALLIILELILHSVYIVLAVASYMGINIISGIESEQKQKVYFIKSIASDLSLISGKIEDEELKKKVERVAEIAKYSDPMSDSSLSMLEATISTRVEDLKDALEAGKTEELDSLIKKIEEKLLERNEKCKLLK